MNRNHSSFVTLLAASLLAGAALWPTLVAAEGAVAVGIAPGGVSRGYASGTAWNHQSMDTAKAKAIEGCKKSPGANAAAYGHCKVVATFHNQCYAQAIDPKNGTPGAGWALGANQQAADEEALKECRATAGTDRRAFCEITDQHCDGDAGPPSGLQLGR